MVPPRWFTFTACHSAHPGPRWFKRLEVALAMESSNQTTGEQDYPVRFSVEYPDRELNRATTAFRLIVAIPILIVAASIGSLAPGEHGAWRFAGGTGGGEVLAPLLMVLFPPKNPPVGFYWDL